MIRKIPSKSLTDRALPPILPPLQKKNTAQNDKSIKNECGTTRPAHFIIRKKISSFIQNSTDRKPNQAFFNQQNTAPKQSDQIANLKLQAGPSKQNFKKNKHPFRHNIASSNTQVCSQQPQEYILNKNNAFEKKKVSFDITQKIVQNINTSKSIVKKSAKKRKVQECKTRKIIWGTKNQAFDHLPISSIKLCDNEGINTPVQSLQDLYVQML